VQDTKGEQRGSRGRSRTLAAAARQHNYTAVVAATQTLDVDRRRPKVTTRIIVPDSISLANFLIFDALHDSAEIVVEKLTNTLSTFSGDETREMGFAQTEQQRLKFAWELCVLYRHNAKKLERNARRLNRVIMLTVFATTLFAVLLTASDQCARPADQNADWQISGYIPALGKWQTMLTVMCTTVPMFAAFLMAISNKFNLEKRWILVVVAGDRVCSEIYRYRSRVGDYQIRNKNAKLEALLQQRANINSRPTDQTANFTRHLSQVDTPDPRSDFQLLVSEATLENTGAVSDAVPNTTRSDLGSPQMQPVSSREQFHENLRAVQTDLMNAETKMASLHKPSLATVNVELTAMLYPFENSDRRNKYCGVSCCARHNATASMTDEHFSHHIMLEDAVEPADFDDGTSNISAELYMVYRLMPAIDRLNATIPKLESSYNMGQGLILFATLAASILGLLGLHLWMPCISALAASVASSASFDQSAARLVGANNSLKQLKNVRIWWQSLSMVEKRFSVHHKEHLVESTEDAIDAELSAWTQSTLRKKHNISASRGGDDDEAAQ
jgi:hypothetical protein